MWNESDLSLLDSHNFLSDFKEKGINRIIIAGNQPGHLKPFFTKIMQSAGNNPEDVLLANFNKFSLHQEDDTNLAIAIVACTLYNVPLTKVITSEDTGVKTTTVVIGGGIAGIQAALEIADSGHKVYLVEKTATIGGHMAMFDKTFPTLDCAACILTPKMVQVGQHPNIELLTLSEIQGLSGFASLTSSMRQ